MKAKDKKTKEPQYYRLLEVQKKFGTAQFGLMSNYVWQEDPKRLLFVLSRYKFAAKMLAGRKNVLEVGCADAFFTRVVKQHVDKLTAVDFDPLFIEDGKTHLNKRWNFTLKLHDILKAPVPGKFDGIYSIDVLEHIKKSSEDRYISNMSASLTDDGMLIIGTPSIQSQAYASGGSREGHVNCKDCEQLKKLMSKYFESVFIFSMNDEVVHTGFCKMANYLFAVCCGKKK